MKAVGCVAIAVALTAWPVVAAAPATVEERVSHCASQHFPTGVEVRFCATSVLAPSHAAAGPPNGYGPENLFDGNPATAWCEGAPGPGKGEQIQIAFSRPQIVKAITIVNSDVRAGAPPGNPVRALKALWPDGTSSTIAIPAQHTPFTFVPGRVRAVMGFGLRIESVGNGRRPDTCLSELSLSLAQP